MSQNGNTFTCNTCGFQWEKGQDGSHRCADYLKTRLDYLYTVAGAACLTWRKQGSKEHRDFAMDITIESLERACQSESGARGNNKEITPDASALLMHETAILIRKYAPLNNESETLTRNNENIKSENSQE